MSKEEFSIQPDASILGVFSRLNYKIWYAIAEFVDNSTQSFYSNENEFTKNGINSITVKVNYDIDNHELTIEDDAFGMNKKDFMRAVKLDSKPENQGGRNEFGMGLKTAASWFGNTWSVESTEYGSNNKFFTEVNIELLKKEKLNTVYIETLKTDKEEHGTKIIIHNITKKINRTSLEKTMNLIRSMYRRDINSGKVKILFNGEELIFTEYECLTHKGKTWKKELDFTFDFDNKKHNVKGFVGILKDGGFAKAGFNLFRRNRVVIGGDLDELNYKPKAIFGQRQSEKSLKLFGELDLDDFPVNQAKDGFIWDDGLEEAFIKELKNNIPEYISIADKTKNELAREENFTEEKSQKVQNESKQFIENLVIPVDNPYENGTLDFGDMPKSDEEKFDEYINEINSESEEKTFASPRQYNVKINDFNTHKLIISWESTGTSTWIKYTDDEPDTTKIVINVNHPFFKPYVNKDDFKSVLEKFVAAYAMSIIMAKQDAGTDGKIIPSVITNKLNDFLGKIEG